MHIFQPFLRLLMVLLAGVWQAHASVVVVPDPPRIKAVSWLLADAGSGRILIEHNADEKLPPASLTKLMTSYVAATELAKGSIHPSDMVLVSKKAWRTKGSRMFIEVDDRVRLEDLLRGMIIQSGNDASIAIAEHISGDEDVFVNAMNQYANALQMTGTNFINATGLPREGHLSTARDLFLLASRMIHDFPVHYELYSEKEFAYGRDRRTGQPIVQRNRNLLLRRDETVDGLKTGRTQDAGYCLVASALRNGMRLITVVMGAESEEDRIRETQKLLTYGFRYFETHKLYAQGEAIEEMNVWGGETASVPVGLAEPVVLTLQRGKFDSLIQDFQPHQLQHWAPLSRGDTVGILLISDAEEGLISQVPVIAMQDVASAGGFKRFWDQLRIMFGGG